MELDERKINARLLREAAEYVLNDENIKALVLIEEVREAIFGKRESIVGEGYEILGSLKK